MGNYNSSNAHDYDVYDDNYYEEEPRYRTAQRPRANVPGGVNVNFVPPEYQRLAPRTLGNEGAPRPVGIPQPFPAGQQTRPISRPLVAGQPQNRAMRAQVPTMDTRRQTRSNPLAGIHLSYGSAKIALMVAGGLVAVLVVYLLVSNVIHWWQTWQDDMTYGRPRTVQVDQLVGHNEADGTPSHFIVQNNNRQITVIEYPGGDVTKTRVIPGPRLFGKDMELAPVKVNFQDINGDSNVDMVLSVENEQFIYINENSNFRPITGEERARLNKLSGGKK